MRINKIEFKNLFAYGEALQTIEYTNEGKLILLQGVSGTGKSSFLSLPSLLLYGKANKIPKTEIANRINKNGYIKGYITKYNHEYIIERHFRPNSIKVFKDGQDIENYGSRDAQDYIDNNIVDVPFQTFTNFMSISMKNFKTFLKMSPSDMKQIIDNVFSMEIINIVFNHIKKDMKEIGERINGDNSTLFYLNKTLQDANTELIKLQDNIKTEENEAKIEENKKKIEEYNQNLTKYTSGYTNVNTKLKETQNNISTIKAEIGKINFGIKTAQAKLDLFSKDKCPTCGQEFSSEKYTAIKQKLQMFIDQQNGLKEQQDKNLQIYLDNQKALNGFLNQITTETNKINRFISDLNYEIKNLTNQIQTLPEFQSIKNIIDNTTEQINTIKENIKVNNDKMIDLQNLLVVYSEDGVKQKIIDNYLPLLNKEIRNNLILLGFPYQLEFDNHFNARLTDMGENISVETLSNGEMTKVDIVVLCSLLKLLKRRYPSINILAIDECLSDLDNISSNHVLKLLKNFVTENKMNCYIVSHTELYLENFDEILDITKNNGFSQIITRTN